jgi:hypothetical protein
MLFIYQLWTRTNWRREWTFSITKYSIITNKSKVITKPKNRFFFLKFFYFSRHQINDERQVNSNHSRRRHDTSNGEKRSTLDNDRHHRKSKSPQQSLSSQVSWNIINIYFSLFYLFRYQKNVNEQREKLHILNNDLNVVQVHLNHLRSKMNRNRHHRLKVKNLNQILIK